MFVHSESANQPAIRHQPWVFALILLSLAANLLYPGEVFSQSKFLLTFVSFLTFLASWLNEIRIGISVTTGKIVAMAFLPLLVLIPSFLGTINGFRSQGVFWLFFSYACLFLTLRFLKLEKHSIVTSLAFICSVAFLINLYCIYQYFFGFSDLKEILMQSKDVDADFREALLTRVGTQRVFAHFALPNTLAGFLSTVLPLQFFLGIVAFGRKELDPVGSSPSIVRLLRSSWVKLVLLFQMVLSFLVLALTQSFGGWVCFLGSTLVLVLLLFKGKKLPMRFILSGLIVFLSVLIFWMIWIAQKRGFGLLNLEASGNPIALRLVNYRTALLIFRDFLWGGVGLGNYGSIFPVYQIHSDRVTQYAHNTILQLLSECGICFAALLAFLVFRCRKTWKKWMAGSRTDDALQKLLQTCLLSSISAWFIHNLLDINFYFPSLGALGVFIFSMLFRPLKSLNGNQDSFHPAFGHPLPKGEGLGVREQPQSDDPHASLIMSPCIPKRHVMILNVTFLFVFSIVSIFALRFYLAETFFSLAMDFTQANQFKKAMGWIDKAVALDQHNAPALVLQSKLKLQIASERGSLGKTALLDLKLAYQKGTRLDPYNAEYHFQLGKIMQALGEIDMAGQEKRKARELFPAEAKYRNN